MAATTKSRAPSSLISPLTLGLPAARIRQLPCDAPVERGIGNFVLLFETERCPLQRVQNVAEIKLGDRSYGVVVLTHGCELVGLE